MSLARLRSVVLLLANNGYCRYWTHWNHPIDDPWEMAVSLLYSAWGSPVVLPELELNYGFRRIDENGLIYYVIARDPDDLAPRA
jgi:hypothetical protein